MEIHWLFIHPIGWFLIAVLVSVLYRGLTILLDLTLNHKKIESEFKYLDSFNAKNCEKEFLSHSERKKEISSRMDNLELQIRNKPIKKLHNFFKIK